MRDLILAYKARKKSHQPDFVPESFIWHAFLGLADALGFLATGRSCVAMSLNLDKTSNPGRGSNYQGGAWRPVIHRDIKPDNIFIRSRDTPGSKKPFYVLLSDFGLAQYEQDAYTRINGLIEAVPEAKSPCGTAVLRKDVFRSFLEKIYKRTK